MVLKWVAKNLVRFHTANKTKKRRQRNKNSTNKTKILNQIEKLF